MFCPNCKSEYRPGFTRCSDCSIELVDDLQIDPMSFRQTSPELGVKYKVIAALLVGGLSFWTPMAVTFLTINPYHLPAILMNNVFPILSIWATYVRFGRPNRLLGLNGTALLMVVGIYIFGPL